MPIGTTKHGRSDLQAAQEEDQEEGQEAAQEQEPVHKTEPAQTVPAHAQRESEMGLRSPQTACSMLHLEVCQGISEGVEASESPLDPEMESAAASQEPDEKNHHPEMQMDPEAWAMPVGE